MADKKVRVIVQAKNAMAAGLSAASSALQKFGQSVKRIGLALGAGLATAGAGLLALAKRAENLNVKLAQVATISSVSMQAAGKEVRKLSSEFGLAKDELAKGLYDALSAGVPSDNVFEFMRVAAKTAKAGAASVTDSVDILTTALNAFKIPASEAESVSDSLFTAVRLGKTTIAELGQSFSMVGPIAAASGVRIQEVLAATASLTKQGTPTAQAMTQIRSAIIAANEHLGDGWSKTMSLQDAFGKMSDMAGGSASAIKTMTGRVEGAMAILAMTGKNAAGAAADLREMAGAAGAMNTAFGKTDVDPITKATQAMDNLGLAIGNVTLVGLTAGLKAAGVEAESLGDILQSTLDKGDATWAIFFENIKYGFIKILDVAGIAVDGIIDALMLVPRLATFQWKKIGSNVKSGLDIAEMHAREHAGRMEEIARKQAEELNKAGDAPTAPAAETDAQRGMRMMREASQRQDALVAESSAKAAEGQWNAWNESFDLQMAAQKKLADEAVKLADEKRKAEADAANQAAQDVIDEMERVQAKREELAAKNVKDVLDEQKQQAQAAKDQLKEARKAERLRKADDPRRGRHLGKQQKEWLAAFDAIAGAQAGLLPGQNAIDAAKQNLLAAQNMEKSLANIELEMAINNRQMKELMMRA